MSFAAGFLISGFGVAALNVIGGLDCVDNFGVSGCGLNFGVEDWGINFRVLCWAGNSGVIGWTGGSGVKRVEGRLSGVDLIASGVDSRIGRHFGGELQCPQERQVMKLTPERINPLEQW